MGEQTLELEEQKAIIECLMIVEGYFQRMSSIAPSAIPYNTQPFAAMMESAMNVLRKSFNNLDREKFS